jgi:hypothetical protein
MLRIILVVTAVLAISIFCQSGCKKKAGETKSEQPPKTTAQYEADAKKQITEDNMQQELRKLEQEVEQDIAAEQ